CIGAFDLCQVVVQLEWFGQRLAQCTVIIDDQYFANGSHMAGLRAGRRAQPRHHLQNTSISSPAVGYYTALVSAASGAGGGRDPASRSTAFSQRSVASPHSGKLAPAA